MQSIPAAVGAFISCPTRQFQRWQPTPSPSPVVEVVKEAACPCHPLSPPV